METVSTTRAADANDDGWNHGGNGLRDKGFTQLWPIMELEKEITRKPLFVVLVNTWQSEDQSGGVGVNSNVPSRPMIER
jgi:hypothetical protein